MLVERLLPGARERLVTVTSDAPLIEAEAVAFTKRVTGQA